MYGISLPFTGGLGGFGVGGLRLGDLVTVN